MRLTKLRVVNWRRWQRTKTKASVLFAIIAVLDGVFLMPTRDLLAAALQLACVGASAALAMSVALAYIAKWEVEYGIDEYYYQ
jgi:hypothetical protein